MTIDELMALARAQPGYEERDTPTTEQEIADLEKALGVVLPESYRAYLRACGYALWEGGMINGIGNVFNDCLSATLYARSAEFSAGGMNPAPANTVLIGQKGEGKCFLFCEGSPRCGEVSCVDEHYRMRSEMEYWRSFEDFFEWNLTPHIENYVVVADFSDYHG